MTGLLTAIAVISTITLLVSATNAGARATASDDHKRGNWGIAHWESARSRALNPHERRWQTALLSGRENDSRWRDLVAEIEKLEWLSNIKPPGQPPTAPDSQWIEDRIAALEASVNSPTSGDPSQ